MKQRVINKPAKTALEPPPKLAGVKAERAYRESQDSAEHLGWSRAQKLYLPNLTPTTKTISVRLP